MTTTIEARGLKKHYGKTTALDGLDLVAERGQVVAVLGPNGAGKTTFVRTLATLLRADEGTLLVAGHDAREEPAAVRRVIGLAGQFAAVEPAMTGRENLEMVASLFGQSRRTARANAAAVLEQLGLLDDADRLARTYSGGMRRRLDVGASLVGAPRLLLLDEPTTAAGRQAGLAKSTLTVTRRVLLRYVRTPQLIVLATVQMSLFFLIYRFMFGGAIHIAGMPYVDYLVPGFLATGVLFTGIGTAAAMAEDLEQGFIDRLRSLPIPRASVLAARALADTALIAWSTAFTAAIAFAVGFTLHGSVVDGLAAFGLVIVFGFAFEWLFITMGLFARNAQAAQGMGMIVFPFAFVSSAYVPVSSMPGWLQVFAEHQPLTYMVDAVRSLTLGPHAPALLGHPSSYFVVRALLWALAILAISLPIAVARYRRG